MGFDIPFALEGKRIWVAGHRGMVGSAIVRQLEGLDCDVLLAGRDRVDLRDQAQTRAWMEQARPHIVFLAAAKVGGIAANAAYPADFIYDNMMIEYNVIEAAFRCHVEKLIFLGSSCIYPRLAPQPIEERALLSGPLEPTNEWYAIAKIAGIKLCQALRLQHGCDFISAMPTNLYGIHDNFDLETSHVLPALIRKTHDAKMRGDRQLVIWGTGQPRREFLFADDCANALVHLARHYSGAEHVNIGSGSDITILELAEIIAGVVGFAGEIVHDLSKPDGTPRKLMNSSKLRALGWRPSVDLHQGIARAYQYFLQTCTNP